METCAHPQGTGATRRDNSNDHRRNATYVAANKHGATIKESTASCSLSRSPSLQVRGCRPPTCSAKQHSQPPTPHVILQHRPTNARLCATKVRGSTTLSKPCLEQLRQLDTVAIHRPHCSRRKLRQRDNAREAWCSPMMRESTTVFKTIRSPGELGVLTRQQDRRNSHSP
jgi:hypothetical protein